MNLLSHTGKHDDTQVIALIFLISDWPYFFSPFFNSLCQDHHEVNDFTVFFQTALRDSTDLISDALSASLGEFNALQQEKLVNNFTKNENISSQCCLVQFEHLYHFFSNQQVWLQNICCSHWPVELRLLEDLSTLVLHHVTRVLFTILYAHIQYMLCLLYMWSQTLGSFGAGPHKKKKIITTVYSHINCVLSES